MERLGKWASDEWAALLAQPSAPSVSVMVLVAVTLFAAVGLAALCGAGGAGIGNSTSFAQRLLACVVRVGRLRNCICRPCDRAAKRYPVAPTCQIPGGIFRSLGDIYSFIFGYKERGLFLEVGAYDGSLFSNTAALADMGWAGHYVEPIPAFARVCADRHKGNKGVKVHNVCIGETDGAEVELSTAGPFSSAVADEIESVSSSALDKTLQAVGWSHKAGAEKVKTTTQSLNSFLASQPDLAKPGAIDIFVLDVEGYEWGILKSFDIARYRPKVAIVEVQELQARYASNERVQADAASLFSFFASAGYRILFKDAINTVFVHRDVPMVGGA